MTIVSLVVESNSLKIVHFSSLLTGTLKSDEAQHLLVGTGNYSSPDWQYNYSYERRLHLRAVQLSEKTAFHIWQSSTLALWNKWITTSNIVIRFLAKESRIAGRTRTGVRSSNERASASILTRVHITLSNDGRGTGLSKVAFRTTASVVPDTHTEFARWTANHCSKV